MKMKQKYDLTGLVVGKLTVTKRAENKTNDRSAIWTCLCSCGKEKDIKATYLRNGRVSHCGCEYLDGNPRKKHGMYGTKEYNTWVRMKQRCFDENLPNYLEYGGRGITVYEPWIDNFLDFYSYIGDAPSVHHSIDRIDNNGNYEPGNVRWADDTTQSNNRRVNRLITHNGETLTISEWAKKLDLNVHTLFSRIDRYNWPLEKALRGKESPL